jgi:hypothetical protein
MGHILWYVVPSSRIAVVVHPEVGSNSYLALFYRWIMKVKIFMVCVFVLAGVVGLPPHPCAANEVTLLYSGETNGRIIPVDV